MYKLIVANLQFYLLPLPLRYYYALLLLSLQTWLARYKKYFKISNNAPVHYYRYLHNSGNNRISSFFVVVFFFFFFLLLLFLFFCLLYQNFATHSLRVSAMNVEAVCATEELFTVVTPKHFALFVSGLKLFNKLGVFLFDGVKVVLCNKKCEYLLLYRVNALKSGSAFLYLVGELFVHCQQLL